MTFCNFRVSSSFKAEQIKQIPGKGIRGTFAVPSLPYPVEIIVGNDALMGIHGIVFERSTIKELVSWKDQAKSIILAAGKYVDQDADDRWIPLAIFAVSGALR